MSRRLAAFLIFLAWTLPGLLTASINLALFPQLLERDNPWVYFGAQLGGWWLWALLTPLIAWVVRRYPLERGRLRRAIWPHAVALLVCLVSYVGVSATLAFLGQATSMRPQTARPESFSMFFRGYLGSRVPISILLYAAVTGLTVAIDERSRRHENDLQTARLRAELARAQLQALQMQLQPHFLFNTLYAISVLIEENPTVASRTIVQLADLLRHTLALADEPEISLRRELEILRGYLDIEETRFGDRLKVAIDVPAELFEIPVPSFVLQPIVENAVRHGVAPRVMAGNITVRARQRGKTLILQVEDDGPGFGSGVDRAPSDAGVGLATTRERLAVRFGGDARITCDAAPNGGALVTIELPIARD